MDIRIVILFAIILIVAGLLLAIIGRSRRGSRRLDIEKYRCKWLQIESSVSRDNEASHHLAILNADKLLDSALRDKGIGGETMGERMKRVSFRNANAVWAAHKLRNQIAHESDVKISYDTVRRALASFKQALKDVGAI